MFFFFLLLHVIPSDAMQANRCTLRYQNAGMALKLASTFNDYTTPVLPAYVLHIDNEIQAALFFDVIGKQRRAIHLVYKKSVMQQRGYMNAFRRLLDRSCCMYYDDLPLSDWLLLAAMTEVPETDSYDFDFDFNSHSSS